MSDASLQGPIVLTTGEPAGIGPELVLSLAAQGLLPGDCVAIGDPGMLASRADQLGLAVQVVIQQPGEPLALAEPGDDRKRLPVWPVSLDAPCVTGVLNPLNAGYVVATLQGAVDACLSGDAAAMVTAPIHKGVIIEGGFPGFTGHTEWLRDACDVDEVVMMLATDDALHARHGSASADLRVALLTTHLPLRDVADALTAERLARVCRILDQGLKHQFGLGSPRIALCGLNPHAGEDGHLGHEEQTIMTPTLETLRGQGLDLQGPFPADTLFTPRKLAGIDAVLAMYHDQGLAVLKYAGFGRAANITLGLPLVRTSVDHGTALDIAGTGRADAGSLLVAIKLARRLATTSSAA